MPSENNNKTRGSWGWVKDIMAPASKVHASRRITALAVIGAAVSVFRFVPPGDATADSFRFAAMVAGVVAMIWLIVLIAFPPKRK